MHQDAAPGLPRVLVFGGNGFVGSRVCEEALKTGLEVVSVNRSGAPRHRAPWVDQVSWVQVRSADQELGNFWQCSLAFIIKGAAMDMAIHLGDILARC